MIQLLDTDHIAFNFLFMLFNFLFVFRKHDSYENGKPQTALLILGSWNNSLKITVCEFVKDNVLTGKLLA